jgi:hypothetical protein
VALEADDVSTAFDDRTTDLLRARLGSAGLLAAEQAFFLGRNRALALEVDDDDVRAELAQRFARYDAEVVEIGVRAFVARRAAIRRRLEGSTTDAR